MKMEGGFPRCTARELLRLVGFICFEPEGWHYLKTNNEPLRATCVVLYTTQLRGLVQRPPEIYEDIQLPTALRATSNILHSSTTISSSQHNVRPAPSSRIQRAFHLRICTPLCFAVCSVRRVVVYAIFKPSLPFSPDGFSLFSTFASSLQLIRVSTNGSEILSRRS